MPDKYDAQLNAIRKLNCILNDNKMLREMREKKEGKVVVDKK